MFYRVKAILNFKDEDEASDFYHDCELAIVKSETINPDQPTQEQGLIQLQRCFHDEVPGRECALIDQETTD